MAKNHNDAVSERTIASFSGDDALITGCVSMQCRPRKLREFGLDPSIDRSPR